MQIQKTKTNTNTRIWEMHNVNPIIKVLGGSGKCSECSTLGGSAKFKSWLENAKVKKKK